MSSKNNSNLFFLCSLIEQIGRDLHKERGKVAAQIGIEGLRQVYEFADVFHCEPIQKVSDDMITQYQLKEGQFNNVEKARFSVPDVWTMGKVYARLIEDVSDEDSIPQTAMDVYTSWIDKSLSDYNSAFFFQPRDYIAECYHRGGIDPE